jgi:hypothetical protein
MTLLSTPNLIEVLRATMENVEQTAGIRADDPSLLELRTILNHRVAEIQNAMASEFALGASESIEDDSPNDCDWRKAS